VPSLYDGGVLDAIKRDTSILEEELRPSVKHPGRGAKKNYTCPVCQDDDGVRVFFDGLNFARWYCVKCHEKDASYKAGTVVDLYCVRDHMTPAAAAQAVYERYGDRYKGTAARRAKASSRPAPTAQIDDNEERQHDDGEEQRTRARRYTYCLKAIDTLWSPAGKKGLDYLRRRGFDDETIKRCRFGYDAKAQVDGVLKYGRAGVIVPSTRAMDAYLVRFLKPFVLGDKECKCMSTPGDGQLYNVQALWAGYDAVFVVEGWADAVSVLQAARAMNGVKVGAVATGGAGFHSLLVNALVARPTTARLLIAMDADDKGRAGAAALSNLMRDNGISHELVNTKLVLLGKKDVNDVLRSDYGDSLGIMLETVLNDTGEYTVKEACIRSKCTATDAQMLRKLETRGSDLKHE